MTRLGSILALLSLLGSGCAHRARVVTSPAGAAVTHVQKDELVGHTPVVLSQVWWPGRKTAVRVQLAGYREVEVVLKRRLFRRKSVHEVVLVKEHPRSGMWTPEDVED